MKIRQALTLLALPLIFTGCSGFVADYKMLEAFAKSPNVSYDNADAWKCDLVKVDQHPRRGGRLRRLHQCRSHFPGRDDQRRAVPG